MGQLFDFLNVWPLGSVPMVFLNIFKAEHA